MGIRMKYYVDSPGEHRFRISGLNSALAKMQGSDTAKKVGSQRGAS